MSTRIKRKKLKAILVENENSYQNPHFALSKTNHGDLTLCELCFYCGEIFHPITYFYFMESSSLVFSYLFPTDSLRKILRSTRIKRNR